MFYYNKRKNPAPTPSDVLKTHSQESPGHKNELFLQHSGKTRPRDAAGGLLLNTCTATDTLLSSVL